MSECTNVDIRDDQVITFVELPASDKLTFYTLLRAVTPGAFVHPAATVEDMYRPDRFARTASGRLDVKPKE